MSRKTLMRFVAGLALGVAQAHAADPVSYPRIVGNSEAAAIEYGQGPPNNIVGGGSVRAVGSGENLELIYEGTPRTQVPMFAHAVGSGENMVIIYSPAPDRATALAAASGSDPRR